MTSAQGGLLKQISLHSALCFQIIQAFSQIVAAGGAWSSALLLLHEVAADLQCWAHPTGGQALVSCVCSSAWCPAYKTQQKHILLLHAA